MNAPPNDVRHFVHKKLLGLAKSAIPLATSFIPGGSTAFNIGRSLVGSTLGRNGAGKLPPALAHLGLTDARRRAITSAGQAAQARGDHKQAAAFLRELGSQGPLLGSPARPSVLRDLGLTDARRSAITRAMRQAVVRGDAKEAAAFMRELGAQGPLRPSSIPPPNPFRERIIQAKPFPVGANFRPRPRARVPQVQPQIQPHPIGASVMPVHRRIERFIGDTFGPQGPECLPGTIKGPGGLCIDPSAILPGGDPLIQRGVGVTMGRYGPAYEGNSRLIQRTTCLPGDLVGNDGLCYNRQSLTHKERMWPRGRQPLLTGGEMRAISVASRAAKKFERTQKRLQQIGMIKKPAQRRAAAKLPPHQHQITSGG